MLFFDVDGAVQTVGDGTVQNAGDGMIQIFGDSESIYTSVNASEAQIDVLEGSLAESLVSDVNFKSGYDDAMLVVSVLHLFVLIVIAVFTIVRRINND